MSRPEISINTERLCPQCQTTKPLAEFGKRGGKLSHLYRSYCRPCQSVTQAKWVKDSGRRFTRYGITEEMYLTMLVLQDSKCGICEIDFSTDESVHIDHSHRTEKVRGLLCSGCNMGLGQFKDNPAALIKAAAYVGANHE